VPAHGVTTALPALTLSAITHLQGVTDERCNPHQELHRLQGRGLALADWGRKNRIAETEMPGLMAIRDEFAPEQPLRGARIAARCT
jgi:hypothetical protein